jgi:hypothetical protein
MKKGIILYEDSRGPDAKFPFHALILRCVAQKLEVPDEDFYLLDRSMASLPLNGVSKVQGHLRDPVRMNLLSKRVGAGPLFAVIDNDKAAHFLSAPKDACKTTLRRQFMTGISPGATLQVVFLHRNLESILEAIREEDPDLVPSETFVGAIDRKNLTDRDLVFVAASKARHVRSYLLKDVKDFSYLIKKVAGGVRG